jgi:hypothetical protein
MSSDQTGLLDSNVRCRRRRRKIGTLSPRREEVEPAVTSIGVTPVVSIRHEGAFKALQQKGIKITDYKENVG